MAECIWEKETNCNSIGNVVRAIIPPSIEQRITSDNIYRLVW